MRNPTTEADAATRATPELLEAVAALVREANALVLGIYQSAFAVNAKADASPVTEADVQAEALITAGLQRLAPDIALVAEEAVAAAGCIPDCGERFWLVDPLDGTKEFIAGRSELTVNIALIRDRAPVAGIVYAPALSTGFIADDARAERFEVTGDAAVARRTSIGCRPCGDMLTAVASRSHATPETARFLDDHGIGACTAIGSSLKFCLVAEGLADVYPRFGRTMEWDTAAGDAVLRRSRAGLLLMLMAALSWPLMAWAGERPLAQAELIGLAPDPTAVAGLGLLLQWRCATARGQWTWWALLMLGTLACLASATTLATMQDGQAMAPLAAAAIALGAAMARRPQRQSRP